MSDNHLRYWFPKTVPENLQALFAVKVVATQTMTSQLHRLLMQEKLQELAEKAGEREMRHALEMSPEHMPSLYEISQSQPARDWVTAIMYSDQMMAQMNKIDWNKETGRLPLAQSEIKEILDDQTFQSLLEYL